MSNKAFAWIASVAEAGSGSGGAANGTYVLLEPDGTQVNANNCSTLFTYSDDAHTIRHLLADNIRDNNSDPTIVVVFVDSPGGIY